MHTDRERAEDGGSRNLLRTQSAGILGKVLNDFAERVTGANRRSGLVLTVGRF